MSIAQSRIHVGSLAVLDILRSRYKSLKSAAKAASYRRARYRATYGELSALTDRELADIGIHRSCIRKVAREELLQEQTNEL